MTDAATLKAITAFGGEGGAWWDSQPMSRSPHGEWMRTLGERWSDWFDYKVRGVDAKRQKERGTLDAYPKKNTDEFCRLDSRHEHLFVETRDIGDIIVNRLRDLGKR